MLTALSLGAGGGAGFLPAGLFPGGAGGLGLAFRPGLEAPLVIVPLAMDATGAGGGGGGAGFAASWCGARYAEGVQPSLEPSSFLPSHHPNAEP